MLRGDVLLVSKNPFMRRGIAQAMARDTLSLAGEETSAEAALSFLQSGHQNVDLIVFDVDSDDGAIGLKAIADQYPQIGIVVLTADLASFAHEQASLAKAKALLSHTVSAEALNLTLQLVVLGEDLFLATGPQPDGLNTVPRPVKATDATFLLSPRETQILRFIKSGASNKLIARELDVAESTVKVHVKSVLRKIEVRNRTQAAIWAMDHLDECDIEAR